MLAEQTVGPRFANSGATGGLTSTNSGATRVAQAHATYMQAVLEGRAFRTGMTATALSANTISLTASTTPIIGVWNPKTSGVNLVVWQAKLTIVVAGNSAVAPGGFVWATSADNGVISTGKSPLNAKTLGTTGSQAKGFDISTALTGLTNNLVIQEGAAFGSLLAAQPATATAIVSDGQTENFDGSLIVPPGGVLALLNTVSTTTVSVTSGLLWEELPI